MQAHPSLVAAVVADRAALGLEERELAVLGVALSPLLVDGIHGRLRVLHPVVGVRQLIAVFGQEVLDLVGRWLVGHLAFLAQALGQPLGENAEQGIGKVEGVHAHVEQTNDGLGR